VSTGGLAHSLCLESYGAERITVDAVGSGASILRKRRFLR
jgi:hypothetical protein